MRPQTGRDHARRDIPLAAVCAECEVAPATERHHWDGDATNNTANVVSLCRPCHLRIDGRLDLLIEKGVQASVAARLAKTHCVHGHPRTPENSYYYPDGRRACRVCQRIRKGRA